jgi:hypothetical protein
MFGNNHRMSEENSKTIKIKVKRIKPHTPKHDGKVEKVLVKTRDYSTSK